MSLYHTCLKYGSYFCLKAKIGFDNESELVAGIRAGEEGAYRILAQQLSRRFLPLITRKAGSREDAEEILNDAAFKIITRINTFKSGKEGSFWSWVFRIIENERIDRYRHQVRREPVKHTSLEKIGEHHVAISDILPCLVEGEEEATPSLSREIIVLREALGQLGERDRLILELHFVAGLSDQEVAARIGTRVDNVRKYRYRAVRRLCSIFKQYPEIRKWQPCG